MPPKWACILLSLIIYAVASTENRNFTAYIEMTEFDYEDFCSETAQAEWEFVNSPSNVTLTIWEEKLISYAAFKNEQKHEIANISGHSINDQYLRYKYNVVEKIGDALLDGKDFRRLVRFSGAIDLLRLTVQKDADCIASRDNNIENKTVTWKTWHEKFSPLAENYSTILPLADKAAKANGAKHVSDYWELLSSYSGGYEQIKYEWNKIADLHKKILKFVIVNLSQKYNININDTVPAYLLGTFQGNDWVPISADVSPYPETMYIIKKNLWKRKLIGKSLYKSASGMSSQVLSQVPQADFWDKSRFDQQCPSRLINFCQDAVSSVSTCFEPTLSNYLSAHKNVGKIVFNQLSVENTPVLNTANRYSALQEGVSELFGILAASPAWLNHIRVLDNSTDNEEHLINSLMITALDTLPRIAYYMSADTWRINAIEAGIQNPEELISSWWKHREEYEGVHSNGTKLPTFLDDDYITNNKPYLSKITGTLLAFQLYEYLMESTEVRYNSIIRKQINIDFLKMIQQGSANDWTKVIDKFLEIDQISADSLLSFFSPLEDFIDELDEDFQYKAIDTKDSELKQLERDVISEMNAPVTTTTTTTTPKSVTNKTKKVNTASLNKLNDGKSDINAIANSNKNLESKSSVHIEQKVENHNILKSVEKSEVPFDESLLDNPGSEEDKKPKINTNKAVWAVGGVLLATVVICIIAIFGRRRCREVPKNRRYE